MPLPRSIVVDFPVHVRQRGDAYQRQGRVTLGPTTRSRLTATVRGTRPYAVEVRRLRDGTPDYECNCPYAADYGLCKHIWATLLAADASGDLAALDLDESLGDDDVGDLVEIDISDLLAPDDRLGVIPIAAPWSALGSRASPHGAAPNLPPWKRQLRAVRQLAATDASAARPATFPAGKRIVYLLDVLPTFGGEGLVVELATQAPQRDGRWGPPKQSQLRHEQWMASPDPADREIVQSLVGARPELDYWRTSSTARRFVLPEAAYETTLRRMCETGRCYALVGPGEPDPEPLGWDDGEPWELVLAIERRDVGDTRGRGGAYRLTGALRRGDERMPLAEPSIFLRGLVVARGRAARLRDSSAFELAAVLRPQQLLDVPQKEVMELLAELYDMPRLPPLELPEELRVEQISVAPRPRLALHPSRTEPWQAAKLDAVLSFDYGGELVDADDEGAAIFKQETRRLVRRDVAAEQAAAARLLAAGVRREHGYHTHEPVLRTDASRLPAIARALAVEGWIVEAEGRRVRTAGDITLKVASGIDWFDLEGTVLFGDIEASLPELLLAMRRGERMVTLGDGSSGILPEEWLERYGALAAASTTADGRVRFTRMQVGLLDAVLATLPEARTDELFERARDELRSFTGIAPLDPPAEFRGELRPYQREGLGWLDFLRRFGFGGCLADDMGLGKTVQALALLEMRRQAGAGPSLVVVPRSLVFNWRQEAARFAPEMRVLDHSGTQRHRAWSESAGHDIVITTYGTLRRDALLFRDVEFDYVILDEAQAIKNASTASAKAARLLRARHRLAMSGTPIENRLSELWSLFEFLNPGMLGSAPAFKRLSAMTHPGGDSRALLAQALRPFILRRTKEQVAPELPERLEQTIEVELAPAERKLYDELRDHYRASLLKRIAKDGMRKSKLHVLEALLRLRQAACHPGLVDRARASGSSSKLDVLVPRVAEAVSEGHKVLVFSQFTSLLAIVRERLDEEGIAYEYLDGKTRDRQRRVERFQTDPECPAFLISLKAGGLGLNLTAADYVFLLDPWWNPATEAQAIDRAHRIGQMRRVFASRLIARGTVEEKVIELQREKRELADAIVGADEGVVAKLGREDLEMLLG